MWWFASVVGAAIASALISLSLAQESDRLCPEQRCERVHLPERPCRDSLYAVAKTNLRTLRYECDARARLRVEASEDQVTMTCLCEREGEEADAGVAQR